MSGVLATRWLWLFILLPALYARAEQFAWEDAGPGLAKIRITNDGPSFTPPSESNAPTSKKI
jgi:hypothetical protein